ncbi:MAG TPA: hypothetical protein VFP34_17635 [Microlunatus sp.]|nr:hypothetical protein [Microlunatus sp.]
MNGRLPSNPGGPPQAYRVTLPNRLPIDLVVYLVESDGEHSGWAIDSHGDAAPQAGEPGHPLLANAALGIDSWQTGDIALVLTKATGGFVCIYEFPKTTVTAPIIFALDNTVLCSPNDIGPPPDPDPDNGIIIPTDGPRILTGCGKTAAGTIMREQFWQRLPSSFCLAPGETRTVSYSLTEGVATTSSEQSTLSASLGLSVTAGWGPISASVNSSLNKSTSSFHSLAVTSTKTSFNEEVFTNPSPTTPMAVLIWQLVDVVTVLDANGQAKAVLITSQSPAIASQPFDPTVVPDLSGDTARAQVARTARARLVPDAA